MDKKKLQCSKCGCDELAFVNVPESVKGEAGIIDFFRYLSLILFCLIGVISAFLFYVSFTASNEIYVTTYLKSGIICFIISLVFLVFYLMLKIIKYFIPYKNNNVIKYVCICCGNVENIENISTYKNTDNEGEIRYVF